jgi:hypothetical protein
MEQPPFEIYAPVRNTINKSLGVVVKAAADNITVQPLSGDRLTFRAQYLAPASPEEAETLAPLIARMKREDQEKSKPRNTPDPEAVRAEYAKFMKHIAARYPAQARAFEEFWAGVLAAAGDAPGQTWAMKPNSSKTPGPVLQVYNPASGKWVYCLACLPGWGLRMEIKKEFLPPGREDLFPIDHAMFGAGRAVELVYARFTPDRQAPYFDCVREIFARFVRPEAPAQAQRVERAAPPPPDNDEEGTDK